jgi:hypothetical protein
MALWQSKPKVQIKTGNNTEPIALDGGVNRHGTIFNIGKNEAWDCKNTTSKVNGALSVKPADTPLVTKLPGGTNSFDQYTGLLGINSYCENKGLNIGYDWISFLCEDPDVADKFYIARWNPLLSPLLGPTLIDYPLTADRGSTIISLQTDTEDYTIVCNTQGVYEDHGSGYTAITNAPKTPIYTYDDNRLFALKGNVLSWCDPTDITNWTTGESGSITITEMKGPGTAIITLNDVVYCFSGKSLHILYGDDTGNYQLSNIIDCGCVGFRAVTKKDDLIYFVDFDGLKVYNAGRVTMISEKVNYFLESMAIFEFSGDYYSGATLAINDDYLYLSYATVAFNDRTIELNLKTNVAHLWDEGYYGFTKVNKKFYGLKATGLYEIGTKNNHTTSWTYETGMNFAGFNKQIITSIPVLLDLPVGSTLKLAFNTNPNTPSWKDIYTFTASANVQKVIIDLPMSDLNNVDWYQLKFYGTGPCTIHYIGTDERVRIR